MSLPKKWKCFSDFKPTVDFLFISKYANISNMVHQHHNYIDTIHTHELQYPAFQKFLSDCRCSYYLKIKNVTLNFLVQSELYVQQYKVGRISWIMFSNWQEETWWMSKIPFYNSFGSSISIIILSCPLNWDGRDLLILRLRKGPFSFPMSKRWIKFNLTRTRKYKKKSNEQA